MRAFPSVLVCSAALLAPAAALAQPPAASSAPPPVSEVRVARLIRELGSEAFGERVLAGQHLAELGSDARFALEAAAQDHDVEVRLRARRLLQRLKTDELWSGAAFELPRTANASDLIPQLAAGTGNRLLMADLYGALQDGKVAFQEPPRGFWQAIDAICEQSQNHLRVHQDGLVLVAGAPGKFPTAYAGPIRGQVLGARREFTEDLHFDSGKSQVSHAFQLNTRFLWEDRLRVVAYRSPPALVEAMTDTGARLSLTQPAGSVWNVANSGMRQVEACMRMHPPPTAARQLDTLTLRWGLIAVGDMATLEVKDLTDRAPHFQDDLELTIEDVRPTTSRQFEVTLVITRDLITPEPRDVLVQENNVVLMDQGGRPFRRQNQSSTLTDHGARLKITFAGESAESQPASLQVAYPRIRSQRELDITFENVPLPVALPD